VLALLALTLSTCAATERTPALAADEASTVRSGGGIVVSNSQFTEGLVVVGTGVATAEPETARVTFGVELRGDDPAAIVDEAANKINRATEAAEDVGVTEEDIRTSGYSLWVENIYNPETGTPTGEVIYHVSHYITPPWATWSGSVICWRRWWRPGARISNQLTGAP